MNPDLKNIVMYVKVENARIQKVPQPKPQALLNSLSTAGWKNLSTTHQDQKDYLNLHLGSTQMLCICMKSERLQNI